ncbi:choline dehydrogenase [Coniochaeta sp. 2T2.1]|nr:choline dehydrogenase [Coniochaeta sp. 2T2.1]
MSPISGRLQALRLLLLVVVAHFSRVIAVPASRNCNATSADYIIVGGGAAGAAVATRLSLGLPRSCILLIEAGPSAPDELRINVPGMKGSTIGTVFDYNFTTVPQQHVNNRVFPAPRGRVLGGSTALNLMTYDRASTPEYDAWEELGNRGWNWKSMLKYMTKSENFTGANTPTYGSAGVGHTGPIKAVVNRYIPEQQNLWIPTLQSLGVPKNLESLGGNPLGVMWQPSSIDPTHYNRSYSANAYLPVAGSNLLVLTSTVVDKVNLKASGNKQVATGVTLSTGQTITAAREVILSAGSIQSPGLLERSGIGQPSVLSALNITQKVNLPGVGENLQDHLRIQSSYQLNPNYTSYDILKYNATYAAEQLQLWKDNRLSHYDYTGSAYTFVNWLSLGALGQMLPLAVRAAAASSSATARKQLSLVSNPAIPQVEVIFSDGYTGSKGYPAATSPLYGQGFFTLISAIQHPFSRGSVHITSTDPSGKPALDPNYLSHEYDVQAAINAIKFARKIATSPPLNSAWVSEYEPGLDVVKTDAQWREFVLNTTASIYHPAGTCSMLPRADGGVVDPSLKVYGTSNLRVVDASIIPLLISAHIQTAVYGIAEFAADKVIADY